MESRSQVSNRDRASHASYDYIGAGIALLLRPPASTAFQAMCVDWSGIQASSPLGAVLRIPLRLVPKGMVLRIRRGPAKGLKWTSGSCNHGCWLGTYELSKQDALLRFVKPGMTIYDIGAQAGFYTLFFSRLVGSEGLVYSFEPSAVAVQALLFHVNSNGLKNVRIVQAAVAERPGLCTFTFDRGATQNMLVSEYDTGLLVPTVSLDDMRITPPSLIKMDVEGAESGVLAGARRVIERYRPILFIALHGEVQHQACRTVLNAVGYRIYDLAGGEIRGPIETDEVYALPEESKDDDTQ